MKSALRHRAHTWHPSGQWQCIDVGYFSSCFFLIPTLAHNFFQHRTSSNQFWHKIFSLFLSKEARIILIYLWSFGVYYLTGYRLFWGICVIKDELEVFLSRMEAALFAERSLPFASLFEVFLGAGTTSAIYTSRIPHQIQGLRCSEMASV